MGFRCLANLNHFKKSHVFRDPAWWRLSESLRAVGVQKQLSAQLTWLAPLAELAVHSNAMDLPASSESPGSSVLIDFNTSRSEVGSATLKKT